MAPPRTSAAPRAEALARPLPPLLVWIITFKALKAAALVGLGVALVLNHGRPVHSLVERAAMAVHLPVTSRLVRWLLEQATALTPSREVGLGTSALVLASLFAIEAMGLWWRQAWARWLTVVATGCLIPVELYEIARHPRLERVAVLLVNVGVVVYLARRKEIA